VRDLSVRFATADGEVRAVDGVSFSVRRGEAVGIVGESGAGKSATVLAVLGLLPPSARSHGSIVFDGRELTDLPPRQWRSLRGRRLALAFTESVTALDPMRSVGDLLVEAVLAHRPLGRREAVAESERALEAAGLTVTRDLMRRYPHQLSGGMRQRVMVAVAVVNDPELLVLDEPTSSLDSIARDRMLRTLTGLRDSSGAAIVLVTHDLAAASVMCDRVLVMRDGRIVESGSTRQVLREPRSAYAAGLVRSVGPGPAPERGPGEPRRDQEDLPRPEALLEVTDLVVRYSRPGTWRSAGSGAAVDGVSLTLNHRESLGLVGESGAGKTSLARAVLQLRRPEAGSVRFAGRELTTMSAGGLREVRARLQVLLQDPFASLDPRMSVGESIAEPLRIHRRWRDGGPERVRELLERVGLGPGYADRYPHELSAGQRQRICLARAVALEPRLLVLDEPVSAVDVSVRAELLELLDEWRESLGLAYLVISHDLSVVRRLCDTVAVMSRGRMVESGPVARVLTDPAHPRTRDLVRAVASLDGSDPNDAGA
jgi:ABC-type glutathione transport system ATPase component